MRDSVAVNRALVLDKWQSTIFLKEQHSESKGWILDMMNCLDSIKDENFSLRDMYRFEPALKEKYPNNNFIKDKIRQQLQVLRDKGLIEFVGRGAYRKVRI